MKVYKYGVFVNIAFLAYFLFIVIGALRYPAEARILPMIVGIAGIILCGSLWYSSHKDKKKTQDESESTEVVAEKTWKRYLPFVIGLIYFVVTFFLGYLISTVLMALIVPYLFGYRNIPKLILFTVIINLAVWFIFSFALKNPLPVGYLLNTIGF